MAVTDSEVEQGAFMEQQQHEKITNDDMTAAHVESKPSDMPTDDVVTAKTWLVVFVSLLCYRDAITRT